MTQVEAAVSDDDPDLEPDVTLETDDTEGTPGADDTGHLDSINAQLLLDLQTDM